MASAVSGLSTGAWALAVGGRGFIHRPSGSGGLSSPTGHLNRSYMDPNYSAGGLLFFFFLKKNKKQKNTLKMRNSIVAAEKPNKESRFHLRQNRVENCHL